MRLAVVGHIEWIRFVRVRQVPSPGGIEPMERVVAVETRPDYHEAWPLPLLRERGTIESGNIILKWEAGQTSALDKASIAGGRG